MKCKNQTSYRFIALKLPFKKRHEMFRKIFKGISLDCFVLCYVTAENYLIIISFVPLIRYTHPLRFTENWSTHPFHKKKKKLMTHHFSVPGTPCFTYGQSIKYIGILTY